MPPPSAGEDVPMSTVRPSASLNLLEGWAPALAEDSPPVEAQPARTSAAARLAMVTVRRDERSLSFITILFACMAVKFYLRCLRLASSKEVFLVRKRRPRGSILLRNFFQFVRAPTAILVFGGFADYFDFFRTHWPGIVAPRVPDKSQRRGDLVVGQNVEGGHDIAAVLVPFDFQRALQPLQNDSDNPIGAFRQDPLRSRERRNIIPSIPRAARHVTGCAHQVENLPALPFPGCHGVNGIHHHHLFIRTVRVINLRVELTAVLQQV